MTLEFRSQTGAAEQAPTRSHPSHSELEVCCINLTGPFNRYIKINDKASYYFLKPYLCKLLYQDRDSSLVPLCLLPVYFLQKT